MLGRRTAELHAALTGDPGTAFAPEPLDAGGLGALANQIGKFSKRMMEMKDERVKVCVCVCFWSGQVTNENKQVE